ncbi:hypothetical protein C7C46_04560 [Streptomyces tateyamensis]|uniref:Uncharacterized protein n=1 Tax=Streptomyces tateyamensis TaxID=565073 RepID=A0A2V4PMN0_9ACTN|nr:hypothetical protein C7C46_04560 [Streptomyces tateyamensis]
MCFQEVTGARRIGRRLTARYPTPADDVTRINSASATGRPLGLPTPTAGAAPGPGTRATGTAVPGRPPRPGRRAAARMPRPAAAAPRPDPLRARRAGRRPRWGQVPRRRTRRPGSR